jgi:hypothetical protein
MESSRADDCDSRESQSTARELSISVHHALGAATASRPRAMSSEKHTHDPPHPLPPCTSTVLRTEAGGEQPPAASYEQPRDSTLPQFDLIERGLRGEVAERWQGESGEQMWIEVYDSVLEERSLLATNHEEDLAGVGLVLEGPRGLCSRAQELISAPDPAHAMFPAKTGLRRI